MSGQYIYTYADAIRHCERFLKVRGVSQDDGAGAQSDIRSCIFQAYRELPGRHTWNYFRRVTRLNLVAPYSTGTVAYDHTGGTYERQLTLSSGTWPTWAIYGEVEIDDVHYRVDDRKSNSVITLDPELNPGADVASGTSYTLFRNYYTLPNDFVKMGYPQLELDGAMSHVSPDVYLSWHRNAFTEGTPAYYTIMRDPSVVGNLALFVYPIPTTAQTLDFNSIYRPRPIVQAGYTKEETKGYVTTVADSATVTGHDTAFDSGMVGSIIRFSENTTSLPTGLDGHNVRVDERVILAVPSATSLTLDAGVNTSLARVKYSISDPIDMEQGMMAAFLRCCEKYLAIHYGLKDYEKIERHYEQAYVLACEEDSRYIGMRAVGIGNFDPITSQMEV